MLNTIWGIQIVKCLTKYIHLDKHKLRENNVIENFVEEKIKTTTKI